MWFNGFEKLTIRLIHSVELALERGATANARPKAKFWSIFEKIHNRATWSINNWFWSELTMTCAATIVIASHCVGLTLPGIILLPGSFSGIVISPRPHRGPLASNRMSFAIFISEQASVFSEPLTSTSVSWDANDSNLFGAEVNFKS